MDINAAAFTDSILTWLQLPLICQPKENKIVLLHLTYSRERIAKGMFCSAYKYLACILQLLFNLCVLFNHKTG